MQTQCGPTIVAPDGQVQTLPTIVPPDGQEQTAPTIAGYYKELQMQTPPDNTERAG